MPEFGWHSAAQYGAFFYFRKKYVDMVIQCEKVGYRYGTCVVTIILVKVRTYREEYVRWNMVRY